MMAKQAGENLIVPGKRLIPMRKFRAAKGLRDGPACTRFDQAAGPAQVFITMKAAGCPAACPIWFVEYCSLA